MDNQPNDIAVEAKAESNEESGAIVAVAQETLPEIFKLKVDHFEEICEYLDFDELMIFGQTCKHLRAVVGYIFQQTYPNARICNTDERVHIDDWKIDGLSPYIQQMSFMGDNWHTTIESNRFNALKEIIFDNVSFTDDKIACIKDILGRIEVIQMRNCDVNNEFFASFLVHCTSMKQLFIEKEVSSEFIIGTDNKWLLKQYPLLERFVLSPNELLPEIKELGTFFEKNSTIKSFTTDCNFLWSNKDLIKSVKIQLDVLTMICINQNQPRSSIYALLKELRDVGFYKQLKLYMGEIDQQDVNEMIPNAGLVKLCAFKISSGIDLSPLIHLKELYLDEGCNCHLDLEKMAAALVNLERLEFKMADRYYIYPFLRTSRKLKGIKVSVLLDGFFDPVNLLKMNNEREKLAHAGKVIIYVSDGVFEMNKWYDKTRSNGSSLVELKRFVSVDWDDDI